MPASDEADEPYDISVVARLTGLSSANLRMWEKRYGVVEPSRSASGRRVYTDEDVRRLTLLKNLSDTGYAIRKTFELSIDELEKLLIETAADRRQVGASSGVKVKAGAGCRVIVVGEHLCETLRSADAGLKGTTTVAEFPDIVATEAATSQESLNADLLLIECAALFEDTVARVQQLIDETQAVRAILVYQYSQRDVVSALDSELSRVTAVRAPISPRELQVACSADIALANRSARLALENAPKIRDASDGVPERQFSDSQLAKIARISSSIACECPHHLAGLLSSLVGFEKYSAECENRNEADAEMHAYLHKTTAHARAIMEDALKVLAEFEGVEVGV